MASQWAIGAFLTGILGAIVLTLTLKQTNSSKWPLPPNVLPLPPNNFIFSAQDTRASYNNILQTYNTLEVLQAELAMLQETGAGTIRIDIGYDSFAQNNTNAIATMDAIVTQIKQSGQKLCIADAAQESFRNNKQTWSNFRDEWVNRVTALSTRYEPDYYITIKEPGWYVPMISNTSAITTASVLTLQQNLYTAVKANSPNCLVGIANSDGSITSGSMEGQIAIALQTSAYVDFIGFDCYGYSGFKNMLSFLHQYPTTKAIWIPEFWPETSNFNATTDAIALASFYTLAVNAGVSMVSPFYTDNFVSYSLSDVTDPATLVSSYQNIRTATFNAYKNIVMS